MIAEIARSLLPSPVVVTNLHDDKSSPTATADPSFKIKEYNYNSHAIINPTLVKFGHPFSQMDGDLYTSPVSVFSWNRYK